MKIAVYHSSSSGGTKREVYEFARQLVNTGHIVDVYRPTFGVKENLPLKEIVRREYVFDLNFLPRLPIRFPGLTHYFDLAGFGINLNRLWKMARQVAKAIDGADYEIVLTHHDPLIQGPCLHRYLATPSAYYCAEPVREIYEPRVSRPYHQAASSMERWQRRWYSPVAWTRRTIVKIIDRSNVRRATRLLTNSFFSMESIYKAYGVRALPTYLGVNVDLFKPLTLERQNFIISVGAVSPLKGFDFLIEALSLVPEKIRPRLMIVGNSASNSESAYLRRLATAQSVNLEILVDVSDEELVRLYNSAVAFGYAAIMEPFGLAPLEALACGTPVVAVKEGGVRESILDDVTGFLTSRDPAQFADRLNSILMQPQLAATMGQHGRADVLKRWTWPQACDRLLENIQVLGNNKPQ